MEKNIIESGGFRRIASNTRPDSKKRIVLSKVAIAEGVTYHIYCNEIGQILLDPQISIPASEIWLYKNPEALEAVAAGIREAAEGKVTRVNSDAL